MNERGNENTNRRGLPAAAISAEEKALRVELAALYRLAAHFKMNDLTYTHITARIPGADEHFLINAFGLLFEEVSASNLVKVNQEGQVLDDTTGLGVNPAGFIIHSAIHRARADITCVMHTHTAAGMAVAAQPDGLLPITQHAMRFHNRIGYHDYEGISLDSEECVRLARDLGPHKAMILRNHGLLACGTSIPDAFNVMYFLERACQAQVGALSSSKPPIAVNPAAIEVTAGVFENMRNYADNDWKAALRMLDRMDVSYRQ